MFWIDSQLGVREATELQTSLRARVAHRSVYRGLPWGLAQPRATDTMRGTGIALGPLTGIPYVVKCQYDDAATSSMLRALNLEGGRKRDSGDGPCTCRHRYAT